MDAGKPTYDARLLWRKGNAKYDAGESGDAPEYDGEHDADDDGYYFYALKQPNETTNETELVEYDGKGYQPDESRNAGTNAGVYEENDGTGYHYAKSNATNDAWQ